MSNSLADLHILWHAISLFQLVDYIRHAYGELLFVILKVCCHF
jgi:hypothetical protein